MTTPFLFVPTFSWPAAPGGLLYTYAAGGTTPQATYSDAAGSTPNANPVVLDSNGSATVRLSASLAYHFVLKDSTGTTTLWDQDQYQASYLAASDIGLLLYPRTAAEIAASVTPTNYTYQSGDPRRYGAALDGLTDDTTALTNWAKCGGALTFPPLTAIISSAIPLVSNTTIRGAQGAKIQTATHDISFFTATSKTNVIVSGIHFKQTSIGAAAHIGGVYLSRCTYCTVSDCEFEGMQWGGVIISASKYCIVRGCYFHDALGGQIADSGDIKVESDASVDSSYNVIDGNICYGNLEFGVAVEDPYSGVLPVKNVVTNNRIGPATGYGILVYMPDSGDSYNQIIGNQVEGITGSIASNVSSGAGIYVVGAGAGGTVVAHNTVRNCCISTANSSLAPAGIGFSGTSSGTVPVTIQGNTIEGMTQYHGILLTGISGGASVSGNTIRMPAANTTGDGIRVTNGANVTVSSNVITQLNTTSSQRGIIFFAQGANCIECACIGNTINGGHQSYIETVQSGGFLVSGLVIQGNIGDGGDNTCIPLLFNSASATDVIVSGNYFLGGTATVISQTGCTNIRYVNNRLRGTGTAILTTSGTCTTSYFDKSNLGTGAGAGVVNAGTGLIVEQLGSAVPAAGTWAVGDCVRNSAPSAAGVFEWICTTAGTGGGTATFKTISNT